MRTKFDVSNLVMLFINTVLKGVADGKGPTAYLREPDKQGWKAVEECQKSVKIYINSEYSAKVDPAKFSCLGHPGNGFAEYFKQSQHKPESIITNQQINALSQQGYFAPEPKNAEGREYSKHRVIVSDVPMINNDFSISKIKIITACAPNLMGTSETDRNKYLDSNGKIKTEAYKKACDEIANLIIYAAKDNQIQPLKIGEFGLGVYLKSLSPDEKNVARAIMYQAFAAACEKYDQNVEWIIWNNGTNAEKVVNNLNKNHFANNRWIQAKSGNLIADLSMWKKQNPDFGELNNGSDRTIGGKLTHFNPTTTEEQLAQNSLIAFVQTKANPHFLDNANVINLSNNSKSPLNSKKPITAPSIDLSGVEGPKTSKTLDANNLVKCLELSCGKQNQAEELALALKEKGLKVYNISLINKFWRVKFESNENALKVATDLVKPLIKSPSTSSSSSAKTNFFASSKTASCFSPEQIAKIDARIDELKYENAASCCNFFSTRKKKKIEALQQLIIIGAQGDQTITEVIKQVGNDPRFKDYIRAGIFSNRTGDLLDSLLDSEKKVSLAI